MGLEIERKFLIKNDKWKKKSNEGTTIIQGYLSTKGARTVRVRIYGDKGFLTIKGKKINFSCSEFEYEIPLADAKELLSLCKFTLIEKKRYLLVHDDMTWEIDIFEGANKGLAIAEIELTSEYQNVTFPKWLGREVSNEKRYTNSNLAEYPYVNWCNIEVLQNN